MIKKINPSHSDKTANRIVGAVMKMARIDFVGDSERLADWGII